jgi:hypothetical protein
MVKQKQSKKIKFSDEFKDIRIYKETAKDLTLYKIHNDLSTYDQAIRMLLMEVKAI